MKKYFILMSITLIFVSFCLGFVYKDDDKTVSDDSVNAFTYGVQNIPENLRTVTNLSIRDKDILCALSKGLIEKDENDKIISVLCSEITQSSDGIQYEFKIRDDIYWSDGSKITCDDIVTFFKELIKEEDENNIQALLDVYGAKQFKDGKVTFMTGVAITNNDGKVVMRLNKPNKDFINELTKPQYRLRKNILMWGDMNKNYNDLVYSGDYKIESADNQNMKLVSVKKDSENKEIINIVKDENTELSMAAFEIKQRDIIIDPPESELSKLAEEKKLITLPINKSTYVYISDKNGDIPLAGRRDIYNNICEALSRFYGDDNKEFELAECSYFREDKNNPTNIQQRKVNLNKKEEWSEPQILTILAEDNTENRNLCRAIEQWFKDNTHITIRYSFVKDEINDEELRNRYDMVLINSEADSNNKQRLFNGFSNYMSDSEKDLFNKANGNYNLLEETLFSDYSILPLAFYNENIGFSDEISTLKIDGNGNINFSSIK